MTGPRIHVAVALVFSLLGALLPRELHAQAYTTEDSTLILSAIHLEDAGDLKGAIRSWEKLLERRPNEYAAMNSIGGLEGKLGDPFKELTWVRKALAIEAKCWKCWVNEGNAFAMMARIDSAQIAYMKAGQLAPKEPLPFYSLGVLAEQRGDLAQAIVHYERSVELDAKFENGYFNLAAVHASKGEFQEAKRNLQKVLELSPNAQDAKEMLEQVEKHMR